MQPSRTILHGIIPVFCVLCVVYFLRDIPAALSPPLYHEDGPNMLEFYASNHDPARIFRYYGGYISLGPNLFGYLIGFLSPLMAIYALYWVPLIFSALVFALLCLPSFEMPHIAPHARPFIALLLGLFPAGNGLLMTNTTFSLWHMAILLCFLCLLWRPQTWVGALLGSVIAVIAATSHPVSVILLPVLIWRLWHARTGFERGALLPVLLVIPVYVWLGVQPDDTVQSKTAAVILPEAMRLFLERGIFETLFSTPARLAFAWRGLDPLIWVLTTLLCGAMIWQARPPARIVVTALLLLGLAGSLFSATVREMPLELTRWGHRYSYLTGVLFLLALVFSLWPVLQRWRPERRWMRPALISGLSVVAVVSFGLKWAYYSHKPVWLAETAQLMNALKTRPAPYCVRMERGEWSFAIRDGPPEQPCETLPPVDPAPE